MRGLSERRLVLFGFVVCAFLVLALLQQRQQDALAALVEDQQDYVQAQCEQRRLNVQTSNDRNSALAAIERDNESADPVIRQRKIDVYQESMLLVPECER